VSKLSKYYLSFLLPSECQIYPNLEFAGLAPGPFAGLILADNGASVIRVDKPSSSPTPINNDLLCRNKRSVAINPKVPSGLQVLKKMIASADVLIDPFRPGVMERLGLGPEVFLGGNGLTGLNEKLIYARMVGYELSDLLNFEH